MTQLDEHIALMSLANEQMAQWTWPATSYRMHVLDDVNLAGTGSRDCYRLADIKAYVAAIEQSDAPADLLVSLDNAGVIIRVHGQLLEDGYYCEPTTSSFRLVQEPIERPGPTKSVDEMVAHVRASFGLNVSDTARALKVERPTVYAWLSGKSSPHESNLQRLVVLERCAQRWDERSSLPAKKLLKIPLSGGLSLLDLLQQDVLDESRILQQIDGLSQQVAATRKPSLRERLRARGETLPSADDQRDVLDTITGRRIDID